MGRRRSRPQCMMRPTRRAGLLAGRLMMGSREEEGGRPTQVKPPPHPHESMISPPPAKKPPPPRTAPWGRAERKRCRGGGWVGWLRLGRKGMPCHRVAPRKRGGSVVPSPPFCCCWLRASSTPPPLAIGCSSGVGAVLLRFRPAAARLS